MANPHEILAQLLPPAQADAVTLAGAEAAECAARILAVVMDALPAVTGLDGRLVMPDEIAGDFEDPHLVVPIELTSAGEQRAAAHLVFPARELAIFLNATADDPADEEQQTIVVATTLLGQVVQALNRDVFRSAESGLVFTLEDLSANNMPELLKMMDEPALALSGTIEGDRIARFSLILPGPFLDALATALPTGPELESTGMEPAPDGHGPSPRTPPGPPPVPREPTPISAAPAAHRARFAPLPEPEPPANRTNIELLAGLQMNVSVELGRTELTVADILGLGPGSVIELDRLAGEPVDILVNNRLVARGEVVVVDENFGVRVVEVVRRGGESEERTG